MATPIPKNAADFDAAEIVGATGGTLRVPFVERTRGVAIDSRVVEQGMLFVALRGASFDAHRFLAEVRDRGARAVLVQRGADVPDGVGVIEVDDTERALGDLAAFHRLRWAGTVVAITGSAGKTTTKELVAAALEADGAKVHRTRGNLNNLIGVPMTIFELDTTFSRAVLEMGTNRRGEIARLAEIGGSDVSVVTLVSAAHTEGLGSLENVAEEKTALVRALRGDGVAVVNGDLPVIRPWLASLRTAKLITFGRDPGNDARLVSFALTPDMRTEATISLPGRDAPITVRLRILGEPAAANATAALAVITALGLDAEAAARRLETVEAPAGRMRSLTGRSGALVLDDSYNANPRSTMLALETVATVAKMRDQGRAIAFLGDMRELGEREAEEHRAVVAHALRLGIGELVLVGEAMAAAARSGGDASRITCVASSSDAAALAVDRVGPDDVVLVKGSRSLAMERVVDALRAPEGGAA